MSISVISTDHYLGYQTKHIFERIKVIWQNKLSWCSMLLDQNWQYWFQVGFEGKCTVLVHGLSLKVVTQLYLWRELPSIVIGLKKLIKTYPCTDGWCKIDCFGDTQRKIIERQPSPGMFRLKIFSSRATKETESFRKKKLKLLRVIFREIVTTWIALKHKLVSYQLKLLTHLYDTV